MPMIEAMEKRCRAPEGAEADRTAASSRAGLARAASVRTEMRRTRGASARNLRRQPRAHGKGRMRAAGSLEQGQAR